MWKVLSESVRGVSHERTGQRCQDTCFASDLKVGGEPVLLLSCADGAGSAELSHVGARLACDGIVRLMAQELSDRQALGQIDAESALRWLYSVRSDLQAEAERCESDLRQLASTLLVAVVGESCAAFFQIGDGAIVVLDNGHYRHVFWPQSGEYANTTNFVTDPTFHECLAFEYRDARVDEVALFTDGLQLVALDYKQKSTHEPFFSPMFETLRKSSSAEELRVPMRSFLQSSRLNERTDDDKTLILATRVHDNGRAL